MASLHEARLIALRIPFMHIRVLLSGGQRSLRGNVINVPTDIFETVNLLPRYINESGTVTVKIKRKMEYTGVYEECIVRPEKVLVALDYLLRYSSYNRTAAIGFDHNWLQQTILELQNADDLELSRQNVSRLTSESTQNLDSDHENDGDDEEIPSDNFSEVDTTEPPAIHDTLIDIIPNVNPLNVAPGQGSQPRYMLYDDHGEEMAFPLLYQGNLKSNIFPKTLKELLITRWELTTSDRRAAQNTEYIFYKYKKYQLNYIKTQSDFAMRFLKQGKKYTAGEVMDDQDRVNIATLDNGFFCF